MTARSVARWQAVGRLALGAGLVAAPGLVARGWVGGVAGKPGARTIAIGFGGRDIAIAVGALAAIQDGSGAAPWVRAGMIADAADLLGTLRARDSLPSLAVPVVVVMAGGSVAVGAWLQSALD
jgi:hypothetical protein